MAKYIGVYQAPTPHTDNIMIIVASEFVLHPGVNLGSKKGEGGLKKGSCLD
jgi:hypothetical protein